MSVATSTNAVVSDPKGAVSAHQPAAQLSNGRKALAFGVMCLGCFIAFLDIQIVSASSQQIGGGLSASQDELSWVQTSYLIAEIIADVHNPIPPIFRARGHHEQRTGGVVTRLSLGRRRSCAHRLRHKRRCVPSP